MDYTFLADLHKEATPLEDGILSRILRKDEKVNVTLFGFSSGQELSAHSAPTPAILYFLDGDAEVRLGGDKVNAGPAPTVDSRHLGEITRQNATHSNKGWDELSLGIR